LVAARLRVLLAEDHTTVREGLRLLLERAEDLEVIDEVSNGDDAVRRAQASDVDLLVMDLSMPGTSGLSALRNLRAVRPDAKVVILTRHADQTYLHEVLRAGASGYVLKQSRHAELLHAIRAVAGGGQHVDSALTHHLAAPFAASDPRKAQRRIPAVTTRESEVLRLSAQGHSNKEIAQKLDVGVKTVEVHKANGMRKLHLDGRIELLRFALMQGWLDEA
jgi:DNA-binding NarL/FixJ family response regulator